MDKPAILDIGIRVVAPSFVNVGEKIGELLRLIEARASCGISWELLTTVNLMAHV